MMQQVKYALSFLAGALYTSAWWCLAFYDIGKSIWMILPVLIALFGSVIICIIVLVTLMENWDD